MASGKIIRRKLANLEGALRYVEGECVRGWDSHGMSKLNKKQYLTGGPGGGPSRMARIHMARAAKLDAQLAALNSRKAAA